MSKNKILIVEDEKDTRFILERLLTKNNFEAMSVPNGEEALKVLDDYNPQVILADWTMPVMDGIQLCRVVKNDEKYKLVYFIILTARVSLKDRVKGLDVGADDFLVKPVENQELLARIRSGMRIHNLQQELKNIEHDKAVIEMACTIGHKINNPLSSLIMSVKNIEDEFLETDKEKYSEDLSVVYQSIEKIKSLADSLSKLSNPGYIDYTPEQKMINLDE